MALTYERSFRIRHYECDAYGHVNHANYLRYMQETALDASAAAGYDIARYQQLQRQWLIRETDITFLRPLHYGDTAVVKTWVQDFRRVRSRRAYEIRHALSGELIAQAHTDWVFLDSQTLQPVSIPPEMILAFMPEGLPAQAPRREPFPTAQPPNLGTFTNKVTVKWRDLDAAGHVNNATYLGYIEDCGLAALSASGWPMPRMVAAGFGIVARRYRLEYRQPALFGDELAVSTFVSEIRRATAVRHATITRIQDQAVVARAVITAVCVDLATGQPCRIPATFLADLAVSP
jgi:acyl-CoA thioester hydrolase